ncbi:hypothetical protein ACET9Q_13190 [Aeromonas caviae]|uniref:hypothetical protein n=1 Tax=Aeromonas caviae TaxID=648 RepID=UPI00190821B2|nr:hypothetical protein [Aeromonas caviae]QQM77856.1 hypothetical protein JH254_21105 [Aeromonas caviae]QQV21591.1 hypothetical protein JJJ22_20765 [Aeromonas caviae]BCR31350.1 hypothetical protein KAM376_43560 [Aeromonas caviae]GJA98212.1 hypothetical protein KAM359_16200 [Aeromonas caviae]GJB41664.1 hypothetical protein KAM369_21390 [Aeromonas caviae]
MSDLIITRHEPDAAVRFSLLADMVVEPGTKEDWDKLHHLHYKAENLPPAPKFWRCRLTTTNDIVAVCVTSSVALLLGPRHDMLPKLKPGNDTTLTNKHRPAWLNANMRRIGRIVTSTMYRGTGVSYRMMNLVCRMEGKRYVEIVSSMAKYNPFDTKAGFVRAPLRRAAAYEAGLKFMAETFECHPADRVAVHQELISQPKPVYERLRRQVAEFYYRHSSREKTGQNLGKTVDDLASMSDLELIRELQQLIFGYTVYALYENPDLGRNVPKQLPLLAFDEQAPDQPLERLCS